MRIKIIIIFLFVVQFYHSQESSDLIVIDEKEIIKGDEQLDEYLPLLKNKKVAIVANVASVVRGSHLVDTLLSRNIQVVKIFSPEHGFRGNADAGEKVSDSIDVRTGLPVISLYGKHKMPTEKDLKNIDVVLFDLQDVGVRFYTYISTLFYVMKACAIHNKMLIVLDRPNPNGFYIDGPVLDTMYKSFVGIIPIPLVYGMTIGELALMINNENIYRPSQNKVDLRIIKLKNYTHNMLVKLHSIPSPNLNAWQSVILYPSLGLFEGTVVSVGRGTEKPFQWIGHPKYPDKTFCFIPKENAISKHPKYKDVECCGLDLSNDEYLIHHPRKINLQWLILFYQKLKIKNFFDKNFDYHAGNSELQKDIRKGLCEDKIRKKWEKDIEAFKEIRKKYLLYE